MFLFLLLFLFLKRLDFVLGRLFSCFDVGCQLAIYRSWTFDVGLLAFLRLLRVLNPKSNIKKSHIGLVVRSRSHFKSGLFGHGLA
jgi:hypothetical protein